ncbi:NAD-dependent epimerase/dehydratase family protein [Chitinophaga polysaccharea]|uniref:NAD-dependent epimerase/dehydratase family protein n=1 Tax=Chitinophaga polysaccharea TaxID=1293035 RepID=UPI001455814F|nr:NAD-dependent epimerase/dehydratase family protein [Chitinophaga polysaccharea]NLR57875.1 NAD-dependent epimerase/dehydratase family protein [Chitinophaga polysaccharea]
MRIAITGASGYIGSVLIPLLRSRNHTLRLLTRKFPVAPADPGIAFVQGHLLDEAAISQLVAGADAVIHLAAMISVDDKPDETLVHTNTEGTRLLAAVARAAGVKRFIHLSSVTAFQQAPYNEPMNEQRGATTNRHGYDYSKALSQTIALEHHCQGMEVTVLAPTAVMGPYDRQPSLIGKAVINMYQGSIPALFPGGVDFVDVRDVAGAIVNALTMGATGRVYLLSGQWVSLVTLQQEIGRIRGRSVSRPVLPLWLIFGMLPLVRLLATINGGPPFYTRQSVYNLIYSNRKIDHGAATAELQFTPRSFTTTLQNTIDWFKQTGMLP